MSYVFYDVAKRIHVNNRPLLNKNSLRTIEAQFVQKLKNNEARPKFTGSYKTKNSRNKVPVSELSELYSPQQTQLQIIFTASVGTKEKTKRENNERSLE